MACYPARARAATQRPVARLHSLARSLATICADVYSLRLKLILDHVLHLPNEIEEIGILLRRQFPDRGNGGVLESPENGRGKRRRMLMTAWSRPKLRDLFGRRCNPSSLIRYEISALVERVEQRVVISPSGLSMSGHFWLRLMQHVPLLASDIPSQFQSFIMWRILERF
jgi:hypothetical protein